MSTETQQEKWTVQELTYSVGVVTPGGYIRVGSDENAEQRARLIAAAPQAFDALVKAHAPLEARLLEIMDTSPPPVTRPIEEALRAIEQAAATALGCTTDEARDYLRKATAATEES